MGIEDDIAKLRAARASVLSQARAEEEERARQRAEAESIRWAEARREEAVLQASMSLGREVIPLVYTPVLEEAMGALNKEAWGDRVWSMVSLNGTIHHTEYEPYVEYPPYNRVKERYTADYVGVGLKRLGQKRKRSHRATILGIPTQSEYVERYDVIFAGQVGKSSGVLTLAYFDTEYDAREIHFPGASNPVFPGTTVRIPGSTPENLAEDLRSLRDPASSLHSGIRASAEQSLLAAIQKLPDFHA